MWRHLSRTRSNISSSSRHISCRQQVSFSKKKKRLRVKFHNLDCKFAPFTFSFLGAMLVSGFRESGSSEVDIDCDPVLFRFILDYLYGAPIEVPSSLIVPLLGLASSYSMIGMRDRLADVLGQNLCIENSCAIFAAAGMLSSSAFLDYS
jgi:BTB/POZ domain